MAAGQFVGPQYAYPGLRYPDNGLRYPFPSPLLPSGALLGARAPLLPQAPLLQPAPLPIVAAPLRPLPEEVYVSLASMLNLIDLGTKFDCFSYLSLSDKIKPSKPFRFGYNIRDDLTANDQAHQQESDGVATVGSYRVNLPDGRVQVVTYRADVNGYVADVQYEGVPIYPEGPLPIVN